MCKQLSCTEHIPYFIFNLILTYLNICLDVLDSFCYTRFSSPIPHPPSLGVEHITEKLSLMDITRPERSAVKRNNCSNCASGKLLAQIFPLYQATPEISSYIGKYRFQPRSPLVAISWITGWSVVGNKNNRIYNDLSYASIHLWNIFSHDRLFSA